MTLLSNPRLAVFGLVLPALLAGGIACFLLGTFFGIAATAITAFLDWNIFKILRRQMRTTVAVEGDGVHFNLYGEERIDLAWPEVTLVGLAVEQGKRGRRARQLFYYKEDGDRLMAVPAEFARFDDLVAETRRCAPGFRDIGLAAGETLKERLRSLLVPPTGTSSGPTTGTPADPSAGSPELA
ncbi:MAG: hypothetical protein A2177_12920 [Spirochaetes bacterium RBG_13_68_11]|nr:MAG: hypothetical protein A2177_12920 [Spirochaetes bacterium RBG_13_68_11]